MRHLFLCVLALSLSGIPETARAELIPYFARKYNVPCSTCHVSPPKLNAFGESFRQSGYRLITAPPRPTVPVAVWISTRSEYTSSEEADRIRNYVNRVEIIAAGNMGTDWLSYFIEWRPVSFESRPDATLRDRSGRFEDLFLTVESRSLAFTVGQFRQIDQVDVSLRPGLSEPIALSAGLPGFGDGSARKQSLRGFAPSARSPAARMAFNTMVNERWEWTASVGIPFPGEFSVPLTSEAGTHASNEFEFDPKGVVVESFVRRGLASYGGHVFFRDRDYFLVNAVTTGTYGPFFWTAVAGLDQVPGKTRTRWSLEGQHLLHRRAAIGGRFEERTGDGLPAAVIPYLNFHFPGTSYTLRLTLEQRIQRLRNATLLEAAVIF